MRIEKTSRMPNRLIFLVLISIFLLLGLSFPLITDSLNFSYSINRYIPLMESKTLQGFTTIFLSIILEAIPFIIAGSILSSLIQVFVTEETIAKLIPKNRLLGTLFAALIGIFFPICDCAIVPVVKRLIKKGVPLHIGITFMLAVPIVNPIVLSSTYYAFSNSWKAVLLRGGLGFIGAMLIGVLVGLINEKENVLKDDSTAYYKSNRYRPTQNHAENCACGCGNPYYNYKRSRNPISLFSSIMEHTTMELHDVGRFLIMGAFLSALMQTFVSRQYLLLIGQHKVYSILAMILLSFLLSVCSETDAFIARTFVGQFTSGSIIAFLLFGPMMDIKNMLMLSSAFKSKFILNLAILIFSICLLFGIGVNIVEAGGGYIWQN